MKNFIVEIVSGGQTGVDRAALDVAITFKIQHNGWCPHGRKAEDGIISKRYHLKEASAPTLEQRFDLDAIYKIRTELNARDSDGTLIIAKDDPVGGTLYTIEMAKKHSKPYFILNLSHHYEVRDIAEWLIKHDIHKLNVAGPRASQTPNIYHLAYGVLQQLLTHKLLSEYELTAEGKTFKARL